MIRRTLAIAIAFCTSCAMSEPDDRLGPASFCESPTLGQSGKEDAKFLTERGTTVIKAMNHTQDWI